MNIQELVGAVMEEFRGELGTALTKQRLEDLRRKYLGKEGRLRAALRSVAQLPPEERGKTGPVVHQAIERITADIDAGVRDLLARLDEEKSWIDRSMPGTIAARGARHPVTQVEYRCLEVFRRLGFELVDGPEVETPFYNFDALNIPEHHPARDLQDTFWVGGDLVLRSHTTSVQARILAKHPEPPVRVISMGRAYRNESVDATHVVMQHQFEGFWLEEGVTFAHLKGILAYAARAVYGQDARLRFKPKFYPYTEPSMGLDLACTSCNGRGCEACHDVGWVTLLGSGMIHRKVLMQFGYDPDRIRGLAFGFGMTRWASQAVSVKRVRDLYEPDLRILEAFRRRR